MKKITVLLLVFILVNSISVYSVSNPIDKSKSFTGFKTETSTNSAKKVFENPLDHVNNFINCRIVKKERNYENWNTICSRIGRCFADGIYSRGAAGAAGGED